MDAEVRRFDDPDEFLAHARDFLVADEARHTILFSVAGRLQRANDEERRGAYLATAERGSEVIAVAGRSPPLQLALSTVADPAVVEAFAADLARAEDPLPGVMGLDAVSASFAEAWEARTGARAEVAMRMRLFECTEAASPDGVPGGFRHATAADRETLIDWLDAFAGEAVPHERRPREEQAEAVDRLLAAPAPRAHVWEHDGRTVSMAVHADEPLASPRVGGVYTPPPLRRRGYAEACVAALTRHLLDAGHARALLFTDLDNPTSNRIYRHIGYRPRGDFTHYTFD